MELFREYLDKIENPEQRARAEEVLRWVVETFPALQPRVAWNQPMFTDHGTFIIGFSVSKHHLAVAPEFAALERFSQAITQAGYEHSKMLLRLPWKKPVPFSLLKEVIRYNIEQKADCKTFWRK